MQRTGLNCKQQAPPAYQSLDHPYHAASRRQNNCALHASKEQSLAKRLAAPTVYIGPLSASPKISSNAPQTPLAMHILRVSRESKLHENPTDRQPPTAENERKQEISTAANFFYTRDAPRISRVFAHPSIYTTAPTHSSYNANLLGSCPFGLHRKGLPTPTITHCITGLLALRRYAQHAGL